MSFFRVFHALVLIASFAFSQKVAFANEKSVSADSMGVIGLNTVPTARMDPLGTARIGGSRTDPYNHAFLGMQIAKPLYINLRQSMHAESLRATPDRVYPGMDFKLRLKEEGRYLPEAVFGMNSALGHKRFSSEYFAFSKRYYDFDFTGGVAWGRLGSKGLIDNPLKHLSSHFGQSRDFNSEDASSPADWFTGDQIGFFGGVEYNTPVNGLSLKADYNADSYGGEKKQYDFKTPSPWSVGFNYSPREWVSLGASLIGADKIMARLTFQSNLFNWKNKSYKDTLGFQLDKTRSSDTWPLLAGEMAEAEQINMGKTRLDGTDFSGVMHMNDYQPATLQLGRAARHLAANAGSNVETITVIPVTNGLRGKAVTFNRRGLEQAMASHRGSPEEIWQNTAFSDDRRSISQKKPTRQFRFIPELSLSLGEDETTHLYRTGFILEEQRQWRHGFTGGTGIRLNIANNLSRMEKFLDVNLNSVRADEDRFAAHRINLDRGFLSWMKTLRPDFHLALTAGYLEEMYAGFGGEVLYRPFHSPFSIGAEGWNAFKRDPFTPLALGIAKNGVFSGHLNFYYDIPGTDITAFAKAGRYLGGDVGGTLGMQTQFGSGVKLKAFVTATNANEKDVFGSDRNLYGGLQLSIPLGNFKYIPQGSEARMKFAQIGRDGGEAIEKPVSLYEVTEPMSYRRLGRNWQEVLN